MLRGENTDMAVLQPKSPLLYKIFQEHGVEDFRWQAEKIMQRFGDARSLRGAAIDMLHTTRFRITFGHLIITIRQISYNLNGRVPKKCKRNSHGMQSEQSTLFSQN